MLHLIVIAGPSGGGKSTHAEGLMTRSDGRRLSFATYLKEAALESGWSGLKDEAGRRYLQDFGFLMKKNYGDDIFARKLIENAEVLIRAGVTTIIVDDHRFAIEFSALKAWEKKAKRSRCVTFVKFCDTKAENIWRKDFLQCKPWALHLSELEWRAFPDDAWDVIFHNDRINGVDNSIERLVTQINWVIETKNKRMKL